MKRAHKWPSLLPAFTVPNRGRKFEWGRFDCALGVCDWIKASTGIDPGEKFRGTYSSEDGANEITGGNLAAFAAGIAAEYGMSEIPVRMARRGDVLFVDNGTPQGALGIVDTSGIAAACVGENGYIRVPMRRWRRAWRVG